MVLDPAEMYVGFDARGGWGQSLDYHTREKLQLAACICPLMQVYKPQLDRCARLWDQPASSETIILVVGQDIRAVSMKLTCCTSGEMAFRARSI